MGFNSKKIMATYDTNSSNQRDAASVFCLREPLPNSYPETSTLQSNATLYRNYGSYTEALSGNSQQKNNSFVIPSIGASNSTHEQHEILARMGGFQTTGHDFRNDILVRQQIDGQNLQVHGLSLSLGTEIPSGIEIPPIHVRNHSSCFDSFYGSNANASISGNEAYNSGTSRDECTRHCENFPPDLYGGDISLHGMSSVGRTVPNSKYLKAAQQLLDEVVDIRKIVKQPDKKSSTFEASKKSSNEEDGQLENDRPCANGVTNSQGSAGNSSRVLSLAEKHDLNKLTKLLSMLDEVDSRYKQYYHQMQIVVSSFDVLAGCGASTSYTALALQTISRHFRCLRDAITGQISATQRNLGEQDASGNNKGIGISRLRYVDRQIWQQGALQHLGMVQHASRPQRGLPESSVSILRAWLFEHFLHPYPKDSDKMMLARQTGLTRSQVSNWFINARVRLWKPMIEEIYKQDADMDSSSSSENASKVTKCDVKASNDMDDDSQHCQSSKANKTKDLRGIADQVLDREITGSTGVATLQSEGHEGETEHGLVMQTKEQRPNFDDCSLFPNERFMTEFGRFKSGTGVSLTLGLQHCEGGNFLPSETHLSLVSMREDDMYNAAIAAATSTLGAAETAELEC